MEQWWLRKAWLSGWRGAASVLQAPLTFGPFGPLATAFQSKGEGSLSLSLFLSLSRELIWAIGQRNPEVEGISCHSIIAFFCKVVTILSPPTSMDVVVMKLLCLILEYVGEQETLWSVLSCSGKVPFTSGFTSISLGTIFFNFLPWNWTT